ncbi:MAG: hypothetical protein R3281_06950 [Balneolaceae bacterium]|nr:hypothetical protein [Balneolaceae bacterium]
MRYFRSHTTKILLIAAVWSGLALYLVRPVQAETATSSFTSWLETVVKQGDEDSEHLRKKLARLSDSGKSLDYLLQQASEIISEHNSEVTLPLEARGSDTEKVYNLLIWEWNSYQTGNGMGKAPLTSASIKSNFLTSVDKLSHTLHGSFSASDLREKIFAKPEPSPVSTSLCHFHIVPLSGGVAIGAP